MNSKVAKCMFGLSFLLMLCSCDKIKRKSQQTISSTKKEIARKKADVGDKIIAHYDAYIPDTKFNKKRFSFKK